MHRSTRMVGIILRLQKGRHTLSDLAEHFGCSTKSIQRDLHEMLSIGVPIITTRGASGGVSIDPAWWLGPLNLSEVEIETIIIAIENAPFLPGGDEVLAKIRTAVRPGRFDRVADDKTRPQLGDTQRADLTNFPDEIRRFIRRGLWLRINYSGGSTPGWRTILPQQLHISEGRWYLASIDERSRDFRTFRLDRILRLEPTIGPSDHAEIIKHARSLPAYSSSTYPEVIAELTPAGVDFCRDHPRLRHCLQGSTLRFHCPPSDYRYQANDLLRMGTDCRVIAPTELIREMIRRTYENLHHLEKKQDTEVSNYEVDTPRRSISR